MDAGSGMGCSLFLRLFHAGDRIIAEPIAKAVQPLQDGVSSLETIDCPSGGENDRLRGHAGHALG